MNYTEWTVNGRTYRLKLSTGETLRLEKKYGGNLLNPLMKTGEGELPSLDYMLDVIHASIQKQHHGVGRTAVQDLYDQWIEYDEGSQMQLISIVVDIFKVSGFFTKEAELDLGEPQKD